MNRRQLARLSELVVAADHALTEAAAEHSWDRDSSQAWSAYERADEGLRKERFAPSEVLAAAEGLRSALVSARSCQILIEIDEQRGRPPAPDTVAGWKQSLALAAEAIESLRSRFVTV